MSDMRPVYTPSHPPTPSPPKNVHLQIIIFAAPN